jgi:hypothetical protein
LVINENLKRGVEFTTCNVDNVPWKIIFRFMGFNGFSKDNKDIQQIIRKADENVDDKVIYLKSKN